MRGIKGKRRERRKEGWKVSRMKDELGEFEIRGNGVESGMQGKRKRRKMGRENDGRRWRGREKGTKDEKSD